MTTRLQITDRARQKAHMEADPFVDTAAPLFVQEAYNEVYGIYAKKGMHMLEADISPTINGSASYTLTPAAGQKLLMVLNVFRVDGSDYYPLKRVQPDMEASARSLTGNEACYYKIKRPNSITSSTQTIQFYPNPTSGTYTIQYVPECPLLTADGDTVLTVGCSDALMACILARKFLTRLDERNEGLEREYLALLDEVNREAEEAEIAPSTIQDTRRHYDIDPFAFRVYRDY